MFSVPPSTDAVHELHVYVLRDPEDISRAEPSRLHLNTDRPRCVARVLAKFWDRAQPATEIIYKTP